MESNQGPNSIFLVPEILEQILVQVPILELISSGNRVCRLWNDIIQHSLVVRRYLSIGIPNIAHAPTFSRDIEPSLAPAGLVYLNIYWTKFNQLMRSFTDPEECVELSQMFFRRFATAMISLNAELIIPPPPPYGFLIEVQGSPLSEPFARATPCNPSHYRCQHDNPVAHVMHELMFRALAIWCIPPFRQRVAFMVAPFAYFRGQKFTFILSSDGESIPCSLDYDEHGLMDRAFKFIGDIGFDNFPGGDCLVTRPQEWCVFRINRRGMDIDLEVEEEDDDEDENNEKEVEERALEGEYNNNKEMVDDEEEEEGEERGGG
ncbi:hypothetical protein TWF694_005379 [Orbilia ellipsospora]|uniref:F-box domain-containing protein n=1 Tax=Orbilia ellipsospora TaxID=2528407 RepID=A0AAV9WZ01_9PEZI